MKVLFISHKDIVSIKDDSYMIKLTSDPQNITSYMYENDIIILINEDKTGRQLVNRFGECKELSQEDIMELILKYT